MSDKTTIMLILFGTLVWLMTVNIERSEYDQQRKTNQGGNTADNTKLYELLY